jgi:hypothetical protein
MIRTVSEFLERLRQHEHAELKKQDITHPPTIGDMYEGLTKHLLERAFPSSSGIDVVAGFITDGRVGSATNLIAWWLLAKARGSPIRIN